MSGFRDGMLTLQKIRTGGNQTVPVQYVNVQPGRQALIGNVQTKPGVGPRRRRGTNGK